MLMTAYFPRTAGSAQVPAMSIRIERHADAATFLAHAGPWLMRAEAEHNLILGVALGLVQRGDAPDPQIFLATVRRNGDVVGCALRTPPYKLAVTRMPDEAVPLLVEAVAAVYGELPAVLGPETVAEAFARGWASRHGVRAEPGMRQRIYRLDRVIHPALLPPGRFQLAQRAHLELIGEWIRAFAEEAHMPDIRSTSIAADKIAAKAMFLWVDEEPVSLAGWTGRSPHGIRIGPVYTPPGKRGRGYAAAVVAAASQRALDSGAELCFLYTELGNPTSNALYQRLGYEPVCDVMDWVFPAPAVNDVSGPR